MNSVTFRAGCDPEVFLTHKGKLVSCIGKVPGNKWHPVQVDYLPKGFTLQQDNVALEFGIPPAGTREEFVKHIQTIKLAGRKYLKGLSYSTESAVIMPDDEMQTAEAHIFGCEPDFNAWTGKENKKPVPPHKNLRSAGGHVHVETQLPKEQVIRAMDLFLGVPSVLMDNGQERRKLYGAAGAYRPKPYGAEYRTLSNFWIFSTKHMKWVWNETANALATVANGYDVLDTRVRECIDTGNRGLAEALVKQYHLKVV